jgi:two-component system OmpR family sensor kinase
MRLTTLMTRPLAAVRRLTARTSLQVKLIVAVVALVAVTLAVISVVGIAVLRGSLVGRLDDQLATVAAANLRGLALGRPLTPPPQASGDVRLPSAFLVQVRDADGKPLRDYSVPLRENQQLPRLHDDNAYLQAQAGAPFTVDATSGGSRWRVLIEPIPDGSGRTLVVAGMLDDIDGTIGRLRAIDLIVSSGCC